jgi:hypothetical protein
MKHEYTFVKFKLNLGIPADTWMLLTSDNADSYQIREFQSPTAKPITHGSILKTRCPTYTDLLEDWKYVTQNSCSIREDDIKGATAAKNHKHWFRMIQRLP